MSLDLHGILFLLFFVKGLDCVLDEGPWFVDEPPWRSEFLNEVGLRVNCSVRGSPIPSVRWTWADGSSLPEVPALRYFSTSDASLVFPPFSPEAFRPDVHSNTYRCIASNSVGTIVSRDVQVKAVVVGERLEARVEGVGGTGGVGLLKCIINAVYMREYVLVSSWVRDTTFNILPGSIDVHNNYHILNDGSLFISSPHAPPYTPHSYQCRVLHTLTGKTILSSKGSIPQNDGDEVRRPEIQFRTSSIIVKENEGVVLPCIANGLPKPSFRWLKREGSGLLPVIDDTSIDSEFRSSSTRSFSSGGLIRVRDGALIITSTKINHKGIYLCNVSNSMGNDFLEIELIVRSPLRVNIQPDRLTVDLGKTAEFSCLTSGEPKASSLSWLKNGVILRSGSGDGRIRFFGHNRLLISGVLREDQGIYQCIAKNDYETSQQAAQLRLGDSYPQFLYRFIEQRLQPGPSISLKCSASGNPTPSVSWLLDGFPLPQSDRLVIGQYANVHGDVISHVNISSVRVEDGGEYQCSFHNRAGTQTHAAPLHIYGEPFVREMPDILATSGQRLTIKCPVGGYPIDNIHWERDGRKLPTSDRQSVSSNGTLKIDPVERSDAGTYSCRAESLKSNRVGSQGSQRSVNLRVMVKPEITPFQFDIGEIGERTSIQCVAKKGDLPMTITWHKNSEEVPSSRDDVNSSPPKVSIRQLDEFSSVLTISRLEENHSGNYTCVAR